MYNKSIFWFRQDLRVYDNRGLLQAIEKSKEILPIFIIDKNLVDSFWWLEDKKFAFLNEALENLDKQIKEKWWDGLTIFYDKPENIIPYLVKKYDIQAIFTNKSYGSYGTKRDENIKNITKIDFFSIKDYLLVEPQEVEQRKVFTSFYKLWQKVGFEHKEIVIDTIKTFTIKEKSTNPIKEKKHPYFTIEFWKKRLNSYIKTSYDDTRNYLDIDGTSKLSPYLRFWIFSIRQVYNIWKEKSESFISELAWRDFWHHIYYYFPYTKDVEFQEKKRSISWSKDEKLFKAWCEWKTWYPIVDACMKQLVETNRMHGRWRMIVSSFLTKDLHIDRRKWEKFFKRYLLDYDEAVNLWNWQWWASVWADPKPLRIFNPMIQSKKFDKQAVFIKKYVPSLEKYKAENIHKLKDLDYIKPIVNHHEEQKITKEIYKKAIN